MGCASATGPLTYQQVILASRNVMVQGTFMNGGANDCPALKAADIAALDPTCAPVADTVTCTAKVSCDLVPRAGTSDKWSAVYTVRNMSILGTLTLNRRTPSAIMTCKYDIVGRFAGTRL